MTSRPNGPSSVMVIGGAGFLGSHLVDRLVAENIPVEVVDDLSSGSLANLAAARSVSESGSLHIHTIDVTVSHFSEVVRLRRPDVIVLLSALTPSTCQPTGAVTSFDVTVSVLEAARQAHVSKVIVTVPAGVLYGDVPARSQPIKEDRERRPVGVAGVTAWAITDLLEMYRRDHEIEFTVLALSTVYGPRQSQDNNVVSSFCWALRRGQQPTIHGDGRQTRDLLYVDDAADAIVRSLNKGGGLLLHIGTGEQTSINDLWEAIGGGLSAQSEPRARHDLTRQSLSSSRARLHLGWSPWTTLKDGLSQTLRSISTAE